MIAANIIQKSWRKYISNKKIKRNIISQIKNIRSKNLIQKWIRNLPYKHKINLNKTHTFYKAYYKQIQLYLHIDIYMSLPSPKNTLKYNIKAQTHSKYLYDILHKNTQCQINQINGRKWLKIRFLDYNHAYEVRTQLSILTYKYYFNGTFIKLFTFSQIQNSKELFLYQDRINKLFRINITFIQNNVKTSKKIQIDNNNPYFIWPFVQQNFCTIFKPQQIHSLPISVFIYNKTKRPLKVNCQLMWISPNSLYFYRKRQKTTIRIKTPKKQIQQVDLSQYLPHLRMKKKRDRQLSMHQHRSLLHGRTRGTSQINQMKLLSQTINIKKH